MKINRKIVTHNIHTITIQIAHPQPQITRGALKKFALAALHSGLPAKFGPTVQSVDLTIRIVSTPEITQLNASYRKKKKPTNVLAFPSDFPEDFGDDTYPLGDVVICADVVAQEAAAQNKDIRAHFAHLVIHGIYHLCGYDHKIAADANIMEELEIKTMQNLNFPNPYLEE